MTVCEPRGLTIRSIDYWREVEDLPTESRINRTKHDAAGRAVEQWDPRLWALQTSDSQTPPNLTTAYSLTGKTLRSISVDAGMQVNLHGLADELLWNRDGRQTDKKVEYDDLLRPVAVFEQGAAQPSRCTERFTYGFPGQGDPARNQYGQLIRHDDPAGTMLFASFAITGECIENPRHFTLDPITPDWPEPIDERERLLEPGTGATTRWRYSALGDVLEQIDAKGNRQTFGLTIDGRLRESRLQLKDQPTWQTLVSEIRYNAQGQVEGEVAGNGVQTTLVYRPEDGRLMVRRAEDANARVLQHLIYDYDRMGNVLSIEDQALPVRYFANQRIDPISRFGYDSLYQLIEAFGWEAGGPNQGPGSVGRTDPAAVSNYRQTYSYDAGGNLLKLTHVGAQHHGRDLQAARYSNRCLPWRNGMPPTEQEIAAAFDAKGNLLELDQGRFLSWDLRNQLQSVSPVERASGRNDQESYVYDGSGQRVRKLRSLQTNVRTVVADVRYLPGLELHTDSGTGELLQVIIAEGGLNSVRVLHWESTPPSGTNDQYRYGFTDHLGSISLELASDARIISRETFYPFGERAYLAGDDVIEVSYKTVRYSGKERDATGLYYYGDRYYIPWLLRWLNPDPKGFVDGPNLYQMVGNSPLTYVDLEGDKKSKAELLQISAGKQAKLLEVTGNRAFDLKHSLLNTAYVGHRMKAAGRRMGAAAGPQLLKGVLETGGSVVGMGMAGPLGAKGGEWAGGKVADAISANIVEKHRLDRPIRLTGHEMNPKQIVEEVEPSKPRSLMTMKLGLKAMDPRTKEGRTQLGKNVVDVVANKGVDKVGKKLGVFGPEAIKVGFEVAIASMGLKAQVLSEIHEDISMDIDLLEYRMDAIRTEFGESGSTDDEVFGQVADLSQQTQAMVQTLRRNQTMIELLAPNPYAGRRQSVSGRLAGKPLARQSSIA